MSNGKTDVFKYAHDVCFTKSFSSSRTVLLQVFHPIPNEAQKRGTFWTEGSWSLLKRFCFGHRCICLVFDCDKKSLKWMELFLT